MTIYLDVPSNCEQWLLFFFFFFGGGGGGGGWGVGGK